MPPTTPKIIWTPNIASLDLLEAFERWQDWEHILRRLDGIKLYAGQIFGWRVAGPNFYEALVRVGAFKLLKEWYERWRVRLIIETGVVKEEPNCDGVKLLYEAIEILHRVRKAGGEVHAFSMDEPLMQIKSKVVDAPYCFDHTQVHRVAETSARFVRRMRDYRGVPCLLLAAWPAHSWDQHADFVDHMALASGTPEGIIVDYDYHGAVDAEMKLHKVAYDLNRLRDRVEAKGVEYGAIVTAQRVTTAGEYWQESLLHLDRLNAILRRPPAYLTVQSWLKGANGMCEVPHNLVSSGPNSHLDLVERVMDIVKPKEERT